MSGTSRDDLRANSFSTRAITLFLPPYCAELSPLERQWPQLKTHELAVSTFEYKAELAKVIVNGTIEPSVRVRYGLERLIPNFA